MKKKIITVAVIVCVGAGVACTYLNKSKSNDGRPQFLTEEVKSGRISESVTATGTVEPVTQVEVGTQVSGILTNLYVDYNSIVKKGQVIAELDKSTLLVDLATRKSNLEAGKSQYEYELANYTRVKSLHEKDLVADSEYESALYKYESAKNTYEVAKNELTRSQTNLGYATIYSPIDGVVLSRSVEQGQTVAASFNTPTLFTIAADLKDMQVVANVDEADIGNVREGQKVQFTVDAYPLDVFNGLVKQVRQKATVVSNVVTYEVVISAANPDLKLKPGLTANVEIVVLDDDCEQLIPLKALAFNPNPQGGNHRKPEGEANQTRVWIEDESGLRPCKVELGERDNINVAVKGLKLGDKVVVGTINAQTKVALPTEAKSPFMPQRPGRK